MKIALTPINSKITGLFDTIRLKREQKFLNKFCTISSDIEGDTFTQLNSARKTIANYAKSKGVTVEFADAEKKVAREQFEWDIDEKMAKSAAKDKLSITVKPLKKLQMRKGGSLMSSSRYVSKDTSETHLYKFKKPILINIASDGVQRTAAGNFEYEDNFLKHVYRIIEKNVKTVERYYNK